MKVQGRKEFDLDRIAVPAGKLEPPYQHTALIWRIPVVRQIVGDKKHDAELIVGRHEFSNRVHQGRSSTQCKVIACSDAEFRFLSRADMMAPAPLVGAGNDSAFAALEWLVEQLAKFEPELRTDRMGRPPTAKGLLRALLSTQQGVSRSALAKREQRKKGGDERAKMPKELATFGLELADDFVGEISKIQSILYHAKSLDTQLLTALKNLKTVAFPASTLGALTGAATALRKAIDEAEPASLCPWCKGIEEVQERCGLCLGTGWVTTAQLQGIDPKLLDSVVPHVFHGGKIVPLHELLVLEDGATENETGNGATLQKVTPPEVESDGFDLDDPSYQEFLVSAAKDCRCKDAPCPACQAGGICDCSGRPDDDDDDDDLGPRDDPRDESDFDDEEELWGT